MTTPADTAELAHDDEVRAWARSTGRPVGAKGKVSDSLRAEYTEHLSGLGHEPGGGAETDPKRPKAARQERRPKPVSRPGGGAMARARAWLNGATPDGKGGAKPKDKPDRPRVPLVRLIEKSWDRVAQVAEHTNVPVARTMQWQSPYFGVVADDMVRGTPIDPALQAIARAESVLTGVGSMIAMPIIVGMITSARNDPNTHGVTAVARQQALHWALAECIDSQLEMFGTRELASKVARSVGNETERKDEVNKIMAMIFAQVPAPIVIPEDATPAEVDDLRAQAERNAQAEQEMRAAAAAIKFMPAPPTEPDRRGEASEAAARSMANSAARAAELGAQAVADAIGGTGWPPSPHPYEVPLPPP